MKIASKYLPMSILTISAIITLINILITFVFPMVIPLSSFVSVRLSVLGIITGKYWLIAISILCCALMGITITSIKNNRIFFPLVFNAYLIADLIVLFPLLIQSIHVQYSGMWQYSIHIIMDVLTFVSIIVYFRDLKVKFKNKSFTDTL